MLKNVRLLSFSLFCLVMLTMSTTSISFVNEVNSDPEDISLDTFSDPIQDIEPNLNPYINNESYFQEVHTDLEKLSSEKEVIITKVDPGITSQKASVVFDDVDLFLLNFTYHEVFFTESSAHDSSGIINYDLKSNTTLTKFSHFPVFLAFYRNNTAEAGSWNTVITQVFIDPLYTSKMGFTFEYGLDYKFVANLLFLNPQIGPSSFKYSFGQTWEFITPLDGSYISDKKTVEVPTFIIPFLQSVGIGVQPKIKADLSSMIQSDDPTVLLSKRDLDFRRAGDIQSFSFNIPEFYNKPQALLELFDFDLDLTLSLEFFLRLRVGFPFINVPIDIHIFSWPLATGTIPLEGAILYQPSVVPSDERPFVYGVAFGFDDQDDNILRPGDEDIEISFIVTNLGKASALGVNVTASSDNVTVTGSAFIDLLLRNRGDFSLLSNFFFDVPSDYPDSRIFIDIIFEYYGPNGSIYSSSFPMYFRVVHPGHAYIEVSNLLGLKFWESGDSIDLQFNITNRGHTDITVANITLFEGLDTDTINPVSVTSSSTNSTGVLPIDSSAILGNISLSSPANHNDGLIYLYLLLYYEDDTFTYIDFFYFAIPIHFQKPDFELVNVIGYDENNNGLFEAGEQVDIRFQIKNNGTSTAFTISAHVYSYSSDLNFSSSQLFFNDLNPDQTGLSTANATVIIAETARNQTAVFGITLYTFDALGNLITKEFNISINIIEAPLPEITLLSYLIDDSSFGNGDTIPDPGEIVFLYVEIDVLHVGLGVYGNISTSANLNFLNTTSPYGSLTNTTSFGMGWVVDVPLNFNGSQVLLEVTVTAQSLSGRIVTKTAYIQFEIATGDLNPPSMELVGGISSIPSTLNVSDTASFSVIVEDLEVEDQIHSGLFGVFIIYRVNGGDYQFLQLTSSTTTFTHTIPTSTLGIYEFVVVAIDNAGNYNLLSAGSNLFSIEIASPTDDTTTPTTPTTPTTTVPTSSIQLVMIVLAVLLLVGNNLKRRD
jgi:hypothetical protein